MSSFVPTSSTISMTILDKVTRRCNLSNFSFCLIHRNKCNDVGQQTSDEKVENSQKQKILDRKEQKYIRNIVKRILGKGAHESSVNFFESVSPVSTPAAARKINAEFALNYYKLEEKDLSDLPVADVQDGTKIYYLDDVLAKVKMVYGKDALLSPHFFGSLDRERFDDKRSLHQMNEAQKLRFSQFFPRILVDFQQENKKDNGAAQANKVVFFALLMNITDFVIKALAFCWTGSNSLFAEMIHSALDVLNQCILYYGNRISIREPDFDFPYGFGNVKYISSLISGFGILSFGCGLSVYNGFQGLVNPNALESLSWGIGLLAISFLLQSASCYRAYREFKKRAREESISLRKYLRSANADPTLKVVFFEDRASIIGVIIALACVGLTHTCCMPAFDSIGSIMIGGLLGVTAFQIIKTNAMYLVGPSLPKQKRKEVIEFMNADPIVRNLRDVKLTYNGVNEYRFKAEIDYNGREITRLYLRDNCDMDALQQELTQIKSRAELEEFMMRHGDELIQKVGDEVDQLERKVRQKFPQIRHMDFESD